MAVCVPFATPGLLFGKRTQEVTGRWPPPLSRRHSGAARPVSREMALPGRRGTTAAAHGSALPPLLPRHGGPVRGDGERLARGSRCPRPRGTFRGQGPPVPSMPPRHRARPGRRRRRREGAGGGAAAPPPGQGRAGQGRARRSSSARLCSSNQRQQRSPPYFASFLVCFCLFGFCLLEVPTIDSGR